MTSDGEHQLHCAAQGGDVDTVKFLVEKTNADINAADKNGRRPVHWAADEGHAHVIRYLVSRGSDVTVRDDDGETPLHAAAWGGDVDTVKFLVEEMNADINAANNTGRRPVHRAVRQGHAHILRYLVSRGYDVTFKTDDGETLLHEAARGGDLDTVKFLVEEMNADINAADKNGARPLHWVAENGHAHVLHYLVQRGCDVTVKTVGGEALLNCAARKGNVDLAKFLIEEKGVDIDDADCKGVRPVHWAALRGNAHVLRYLVSRGCDVTVADDDGQTPLHLAAWGGHLDIVKFLVEEMNADIEAADKEGRRPVHRAARRGHTHVLRYLESCGCDMTGSDDDPLIAAPFFLQLLRQYFN